MSCPWDYEKHQEWPKDSSSGNKRFVGSSRGLFGRIVWRLHPMCYPCKMSHHLAKRCAVSKENMWRENLEISWSATKLGPFQDHPTYSQSKYTWKAISVPSAQHRRVSLTTLHLDMIETTWEQVDIIALGYDSYLWVEKYSQNSYFNSYPYAGEWDCRKETDILKNK